MSDHRVLILDDDELVAQVVAFVAEDAGFETRVATNATKLFDEITQWDPTHIVLDVMMPDMDGVQVMERLASLGSRARIVIVSGIGSGALDEVRARAVALGLDVAGALAKPFRATEMEVMLGVVRP